MDFIQSAIEKARRERQLRSGGAESSQTVLLEGDAPLPQTPRGDSGAARVAADPLAERDALWASLPELHMRKGDLERHRVLALGGGSEAATFDIMRTKLLQQMRSNKWRRVAITSPTPSCGKTTLSLNLAFSLARQRDICSMLVELDLRRPSVTKVLGLQETRQFARVLEGKAAPEDHLLRHGRNLLVGPSAHRAADPAELLQSVETGRVMDAVEARFAPDVMLFDMPPMLVSDDTLAFIDQVDCVLLVAAAGTSTMAEITRCAEELAARCNFLGVVLNKCRYLDGDDAYGYGYGTGGYGTRY